MGQEPSAEGLDALPRTSRILPGLCSFLEGLRGKLTLSPCAELIPYSQKPDIHFMTKDLLLPRPPVVH